MLQFIWKVLSKIYKEYGMSGISAVITFLFIASLFIINYIITILNIDEVEFDGIYYKRKYKKYIKMLEEDIIETPRNKPEHYVLGYLYIIVGEFHRAIEIFHKLLRLAPDHTAAYFYLAVAYLETGDIKNAERFYDTGAQMRLWNIKEYEVWDIKGWLYYKEGNIEEAYKCYDKVVAKGKRRINKTWRRKNTMINYHLGVISKHKGEYEKALEYFKKSIKAGGPESIFSKRSEEEIKRIEEMIDKGLK